MAALFLTAQFTPPPSGGGGPSAFSAITAGTNTAALVIGSGGSLKSSGTGTIQATSLVNGIVVTHYDFFDTGRGSGAAGAATGGRWSGLAASADPICFGTSPFLWCGVHIGTTGTMGSVYAAWDVPANITGTVNLLADVELVGGTGTANVDLATACYVNGAAYTDTPTFATPVTGTVSSATAGNRTIVAFNGINTCAATDQASIRFRARVAIETYTGELYLRGATLVYQTLN